MADSVSCVGGFILLSIYLNLCVCVCVKGNITDDSFRSEAGTWYTVYIKYKVYIRQMAG